MRSLLLTLVMIALSGCGGHGTVTGPEGSSNEDWSYPPDSSKVALTIVAPDSGRVGELFDVKLVVYNVQELFGAAVNVRYDRHRVAIESVRIGPAIESGGHTLGVAFDDTTHGIVQVAATLRNGEMAKPRTSGVLCRLRCRIVTRETARFDIPGDFDLTTNAGGPVPNLGQVRREDARVSIR